MSIKYKYTHQNFIYAHREKEIHCRDCLFPRGIWSFHISKYIWPKSILSDILQLCIPTNQLEQPHSQSLNNYSDSAQELAHPPSPQMP
jgi:hypothetical protein